MLKLRDRLSDPFLEACRLANGGLLGKRPSEALRRVEAYIGAPSASWSVREWEQAAEILGHFADELQRRTREAAFQRKRGPRPKQGLLQVGRGRGAPRKLSEAEERERFELFERWKATEGQRLGKKLTDKRAAQALWLTILQGRDRGLPLSAVKRREEASRKADAFTKDISRWRKKYGVPLRNRKARLR